MTVYGIAHAKHPAGRIVAGIHLIDGPGRSRADGDVEGLVADQIADDRYRLVVGQGTFALFDVVAPDEQPLVPWPHHAHETGTDAADLRTRLQHPVQNTRTMGDVFGQIDMGHNVHAAGAAHLAFHRQANHLGDTAAATVGANQIFGADL